MGRDPLFNSELESEVRDVPRRANALRTLFAEWSEASGLNDKHVCILQVLLDDLHEGAVAAEAALDAAFEQVRRGRG